MPASLIPFPSRRRIGFIHRHARRLTELSGRSAERYLTQQLRVQAETMLRKGISPELVARERQHLETAIRAEAGRLIVAGVA